VEKLPTAEEVKEFLSENGNLAAVSELSEEEIHQKAKEYLENNEPAAAWKILLANKK
jgi:uncharacterized protein with ATP-grasp and redox domains